SATFESMAESLRGGLSLGLGGFGFWSHDIGGFEQTAPAEVYKRWCAFGLLSSHSRLHGNTSYRVPWNFDEEAVAVLRHFTQLKHRLMPYLYAAAVQAHQQGLPMLRAMLLEFPHDPGCEYLERQYMLGEALLVAPVMSFDGLVSYYLPAGRWTHLLTGEILEGPGWQSAQHDFFSLPLWVRPGTLLPVGARHDRPDYDYAAGLTLQVYEFQDGDRRLVEIPALDGSVAARFQVEQQQGCLQVQLLAAPGAPGGPGADWQVVLVNVQQVAGVQNGQMQASPAGLQVRPRAGALGVEIVRWKV
ncbi:MAG: hypothetical protein JW862_10685, partial [Anaerolineales bacterium]|nr:hypothetical protein [Anaerolineales bacterium]